MLKKKLTQSSSDDDDDEPITAILSQITDTIYLSDALISQNKPQLMKAGITHVIVCARGLKAYFPDDFNYYHMELEDDMKQDISQHIPGLLNYLEKVFNNATQTPKILFHCSQGVSRSAAMVIASLMYFDNQNYQETYEQVKKKRDAISPNLNFQRQLQKLKYSKGEDGGGGVEILK